MQQLETNSTVQAKKILYPTCNKPGFHLGEPINHICLEKNCINTNLLCSFCIEDTHKKHKIQPIKVLFSNAQQTILNSEKIKNEQQKEEQEKGTQNQNSQQIDEKQILEKVASLKKESIKQHQENVIKWNETFKQMEKELENYYQRLEQQVHQKTGAAKELQNFIKEIYNKQYTTNSLKETIDMLFDFVPIDSKQINDITTESLQNSITSEAKHIEDFLIQKNTSIGSTFDSILQTIEKKLVLTNFREEKSGQIAKINGIDGNGIINNTSANTDKWNFSKTLKHQNIELINEISVKSTNKQYKFALIDQALDLKTKQQFGFKVLKNPQNWVGVGICHKKLVEAKNFVFSFQQSNHGAYLITSNKVSYSTYSPGANNIPQAFPFAVGDLVIVNFDPQQKLVTFTNERTKQTHKLNINIQSNKPLENEFHPCCVFYHNDSEVQYVSI